MAAQATADSLADRRFMQAALALAGRGLGNVWPNPAVGCIIVKDGVVVGRESFTCVSSLTQKGQRIGLRPYKVG